jgi:TPR repeat protein
MLLEKGNDVPRDARTSSEVVSQECRAGLSPAQYRLANAYWSGADGKQEQVKALAWALIANSNGEKFSAAAVQEYRAGMTPKQIKAAEH